MMMRS
jgi:hypothetical protein